MATIYPHPTLLQSPSHIQAFEQRHGLLIVLGNTGPIAIPALHLRPAARPAPAAAGWTGGDAA